jgi:hypothetical protein
MVIRSDKDESSNAGRSLDDWSKFSGNYVEAGSESAGRRILNQTEQVRSFHGWLSLQFLNRYCYKFSLAVFTKVQAEACTFSLTASGQDPVAS